MRAAELGNQTPYVVADEKALGLQEVDLVTDDYRDIHRYQIIYVIRNDVPAKYVTDLGPSIRWPNPPLNIFSAMEHSVAELQEMAEDAKDRSNVINKIAALEEESAEGGIIKEYLERKENERKVAYNKSHFGPTVRVQRIGYSRRKK